MKKIPVSLRIPVSGKIPIGFSMFKEGQPELSSEACLASIASVRDALYVLNGKWKLPIIVGLRNGPLRFKELQRALGDITPKVLSKELRELELNEFVERKVFNTVPVTVTYELTPYSDTLGTIIEALRSWGQQHKQHIIAKRKKEVKSAEVTYSEVHPY